MVTRIRELRESKNIKATDVAHSLNVSKTTYAAWEKGTEPNYEMLKKIADYFHVSIDYLLFRTDKNDEEQNDCKQILALTYEYNKKPAYSDKVGWVLVNSDSNSCIDAEGNTLNFEEVGNLYTGIPESLLDATQFEKPLTCQELYGRTKECWVQPLSNDPKLNEMLKGWYRPMDKYVTNKSGFRFFYSTYNIQWIAFDQQK